MWHIQLGNRFVTQQNIVSTKTYNYNNIPKTNN